MMGEIVVVVMLESGNRRRVDRIRCGRECDFNVTCSSGDWPRRTKSFDLLKGGFAIFLGIMEN